jgi:hypothetical protein
MMRVSTIIVPTKDKQPCIIDVMKQAWLATKTLVPHKLIAKENIGYVPFLETMDVLYLCKCNIMLCILAFCCNNEG